MNAALSESFSTVDQASPLLAAFVASQSNLWQDSETTLTTIKSASYADGLKACWETLGASEKSAVFFAVESAVATIPEHPLTTDTHDDLSTVWSTGFLETLSHHVDTGALPKEEIIGLLGPASLKYLNAWNEYNGIKPY